MSENKEKLQKLNLPRAKDYKKAQERAHVKA